LKTLNTFILPLLILLISVGCSARKASVSTKLKFYSGNLLSTIQLNGGILVIGRNAAHTEDISFVLHSLDESKILNLSKGKWEFAAFGWSGENGNFTGSNKCAYTDFVDLTQDEQVISFNLSTLNCAKTFTIENDKMSEDSFIDLTTGAYQPFKLITCNATALTSANCPSNVFNTSFKSYKLVLNSFSKNNPNGAEALVSNCYSAIDPNNALRLPTGTVLNGSVMKYSLLFFTDTTCSTQPIVSQFFRGFINQPANPLDAKVLFDINDVTTLIINPSLVQAPPPFLLNAGIFGSNSTAMTLDFPATPPDIAYVCASEVNDSSGCTWMAFSNTLSITATSGADGNRTFHVWGKDAVGHIFYLGNQTTVYDSTPPATVSVTSNDLNGVPGVLNIAWTGGTDVNLLKFETKLCADSACSTVLDTHQVFPNAAYTDSFVIPATIGRYFVRVTAFDKVGNIANPTTIDSGLVCPSEYIYVPANTNLGVSSFCVMKFEAKNVSSIATSQAASVPWMNITQPLANTACTNLGTSYFLISNPEWQTIARNIENVSSNWSGATVGTGAVTIGHSDGTPSYAMAVSNVTNSYDGTGNTSLQNDGLGREQKRTLSLSSGQTIWDFSGNAAEWVNWTMTTSLQIAPTTCIQGSTELSSVSCGGLSGDDYLPSNASFISTQGMGKFYAGAGSGGSAFRGGDWANSTNDGIFALDIFSNSVYSTSSVGFRCVYRP
jgi:hypothetical protein